MSKNLAAAKPAQSARLTDDQINTLYIQIKSIVRHFKTILFEDSIVADIQERICKLNKVKSFTKLTQTQYNHTMHYLRNIERTMYQYYWCMSLIENNLLTSLLSRKIDSTTIIYDHEKYGIGSNQLTRIQRLSKKLVNVNILKELY